MNLQISDGLLILLHHGILILLDFQEEPFYFFVFLLNLLDHRLDFLQLVYACVINLDHLFAG
jgi:hypothetical protein